MFNLRKTMVMALAVACAGSSQAVLFFYGDDPLTGPGDPRPNSNTAASNFDTVAASINSISVITWENMPLGQQAVYNPKPGVSATQTNVGAIAGIDNFNTGDLGYNTTPFGNKFLRHAPDFSRLDSELKFSFATKIAAFGFYLTGIESALPGTYFLEFTDGGGNFHSLLIPKPVSGGALGATQFIGVVDAAQPGMTGFSIVVRGDRANGSDFVGIDDIRYTNCEVVPEPASFAALGLGLAVLLRRRKA